MVESANLEVIKYGERISDTCWASIITMIASYKDSYSYTVAEALSTYFPQYIDYYRQGVGIPNTDFYSMMNHLGLFSQHVQYLEPSDVTNILKDYGPFIIQTQFGGRDHTLMVTGTNGDCSYDTATVNVMDPLKDAPKKYEWDYFSKYTIPSIIYYFPRQ